MNPVCALETLQTGGKLCALNNCMIRLQSIVLITEHLYDYRTLCKFWSHGEKQMSTKGAVMKFVVKKPKSGYRFTRTSSPFSSSRETPFEELKTTVLLCICWNFTLAVLEKAYRNPFALTSIGLWENPEYIHSLHGCCKNPCIRHKWLKSTKLSL